jgi:hypothetical protein
MASLQTKLPWDFKYNKQPLMPNKHTGAYIDHIGQTQEMLDVENLGYLRLSPCQRRLTCKWKDFDGVSAPSLGFLGVFKKISAPMERSRLLSPTIQIRASALGRTRTCIRGRAI